MDQTFRFDPYADGKEDEISMLGKGSGFLALDIDGNRPCYKIRRYDIIVKKYLSSKR